MPCKIAHAQNLKLYNRANFFRFQFESFMKVRTRVAPSPLATPTLVRAYIALFNLALPNSMAVSLLRIEDTDQARSTRESEQAIMDSLRWLGFRGVRRPRCRRPTRPVSSKRARCTSSATSAGVAGARPCV